MIDVGRMLRRWVQVSCYEVFCRKLVTFPGCRERDKMALLKQMGNPAHVLCPHMQDLVGDGSQRP